MNCEDDYLRDEVLIDIENICEDSSDWQEALEKLTNSYPYLDAKTIDMLIDKNFFKREAK